ncbi:hypothetical protein JZ751_015544 [Albula glossodonta]|uniref:Promethin n=1 Tax=Albula glossodonta TaxID=121402 RepID=A0A8T2MQS7_9TELE|nr:hypothetical protein JZ751_015544 [Albula glossodonta]
MSRVTALIPARTYWHREENDHSVGGAPCASGFCLNTGVITPRHTGRASAVTLEYRNFVLASPVAVGQNADGAAGNSVFSLFTPAMISFCPMMQCREVVSLPRLLLQLRCRFRAAMDVLTSDPKCMPHPSASVCVILQVAEFMNTSLGKYLESHPFLTLSLLVFGAMAMVPVSLFLVFVVVTFIAATVGFIFLEVFLLSLGGATLLCVLCGIALVAIVVSSILCAVYITTSNVLNLYYSQRLSAEERDPSQIQGSRTPTGQ